MRENPVILVTGAAGFLGSATVRGLCAAFPQAHVIGLDVKPRAPWQGEVAAEYRVLDVRDAVVLRALACAVRADVVVHLASIVTPPPGMDRETMRKIDVDGARNVLEACVAAGVRQLVVTTSGAAYGYHADNPDWLDEQDPLRGNPEFAYSNHKRQVEALLAEYRHTAPHLEQLVLRPGTVLGRGVQNPITALFDKPFVLGVAGSDSPFVFIQDEDVVAIIVQGIARQSAGVYNLAGDGAVTMRDVARELGRPYLPVPAWLLRALLGVLHPLGLSQYGPEQVRFLQYRPVLSNRRLKEVFGYRPARSSLEVFRHFLATRSAP